MNEKFEKEKKGFEEQQTEVCDSGDGDSCVWSSLETALSGLLEAPVAIYYAPFGPVQKGPI